MRDDREQDHRLITCPICGLHDRLFRVRERYMCERCGQDEIKLWNRIIHEENGDVESNSIQRNDGSGQ